MDGKKDAALGATNHIKADWEEDILDDPRLEKLWNKVRLPLRLAGCGGGEPS